MTKRSRTVEIFLGMSKRREQLKLPMVFNGLREKLTKHTLKDRIIMPWEKILIEEIRKSNFVWKKQLCVAMEEGGTVLNIDSNDVCSILFLNIWCLN